MFTRMNNFITETGKGNCTKKEEVGMSRKCPSLESLPVLNDRAKWKSIRETPCNNSGQSSLIIWFLNQILTTLRSRIITLLYKHLDSAS